MQWLMSKFRGWRLAVRGAADVGMDSEITEYELRQLKAEHESQIEQLLQQLAFAQYHASIRVSVFTRLKGQGRGSMLAVMRPADHCEQQQVPLDEGLAVKIVHQYNRDLRPFQTRPIGCVVWSANTRFAPSTPVPASIISSPER